MFSNSAAPKIFSSRVRDFLIRQEDINNLPLGILLNLTAVRLRNRPFSLMWRREQICLAMVMTTGHLVLAHPEGDWRRAIETATTWLARHNIPLSGVIGPGNLPSTLPGCGSPSSLRKWSRASTAWTPSSRSPFLPAS